MDLAVGDTVFYPSHGSAVIESLETRRIKGEDTTYVVLRIADDNGLVVRIPARELERVGARPALDAAEVERLFHLLAADANENPVPWAQRCRGYADAAPAGQGQTNPGRTRGVQSGHHTAAGRVVSGCRTARRPFDALTPPRRSRSSRRQVCPPCRGVTGGPPVQASDLIEWPIKRERKPSSTAKHEPKGAAPTPPG